MKAILDAAHGILKRSNKSAEEISELAFGVDENGNVRKSHWTLYKELNPNDSTAKLGVIDLFRLMEVTHDVGPLEVIADKLGYLLISKKDVHPDRPTWQGEHAQDSSDLGEMARLMDEGAPPADVQRIAAHLVQNIEETAVQYGRNYDVGIIANPSKQ